LARWHTREDQDQDQDQERPHPPSAPSPAAQGKEKRLLPRLRRGRKGGGFPRVRGKLSPKGLKGGRSWRGGARAKFKIKIKIKSRSRAPPSAFGTSPRCAGEGKAVASPARGGSCPEGTEGGTLLARWRTREDQDQVQDHPHPPSAPSPAT